MSKPTIAIVGRPNVGKSTLFNRLIGRQAAIVQDMPGVTRDRHYGEGTVLGWDFIAVDTGGFEPESTEGMLGAMREQAEIAITEADAVIAVYDGPAGLTPVDREIVRILARTNKPVFHAVNKIDGPKHDALVAEFWETGVSMLHPVSAQHGGGVLDLMEFVIDAFPEDPHADEDQDASVTRIAVIGKPNAGKSTLVNRMLGEERLLVSDVPGTTRDAIDTWIERPADPTAVSRAQARFDDAQARFDAAQQQPADVDEPPEFDDDDPFYIPPLVGEELRDPTSIDMEDPDWKPPTDDSLERDLEKAREALAVSNTDRRYLMIDTAGIRRRKWIKTRIERVSIVQSFKSIDRAEVCLLLIDATKGVTDQDAKLAGLIHAKGRAAVILVNKWDIVADKDTDTAGEFVKELRRDLPFVSYAPIVFISAKTGQRTHKILQAVDQAKEAAHKRIPTGALNRQLAYIIRKHQPPIHKNRRLKFYFGSQVAVAPPTFLFWVNDPEAVHFSYERFVYNQLRAKWDFEGTPIKLIMRKRQAGKKR
ncbi:MAG: ribosome biogenesis GTPase Der [Myxococcota bacterium]